MNRKEFFQVLFRPIAKAIDSLNDDTVKTRPPGAMPEEQFLKLCTGCDECMKACPVNAIMIDDLQLRHPVIYPKQNPCIHCPDTPCITACPSLALSRQTASLSTYEDLEERHNPLLPAK